MRVFVGGHTVYKEGNRYSILPDLVTIKSNVHNYALPNRSSPKLPQPIFFPTRKFGPTSMTPELSEFWLGALFGRVRKTDCG